MKIILYVKPGDDPNAIAERAKQILEANTGKPCSVRITGGLASQGPPLMEVPLGY